MVTPLTALTVPDIIGTVKELNAQGVEFMNTPGTYYDMLPERLKEIGVVNIDEDIEVLRELQILVDLRKVGRGTQVRVVVVSRKG